MTSRRKGQTLVLHFSRYARPDMTRLRVDPPRWLKGASERDAGGLEITLNGAGRMTPTTTQGRRG